MKAVYLIRHGETDYNKLKRMQGRGINASINEKGKEQAVAVAEWLRDKPVNNVITSSLKRAIESAAPICECKEVTHESYTELDEMNFGELEGKPFMEVKSDLLHLHENWSNGNLKAAPANGEYPIEVFERANAKVIEILYSNGSNHIVFMLHGRLIRILLSEWLGLGLQNMHQIEHQNGAINHLIWRDGIFEAVRLNITSHLTQGFLD